MFRPAADTRESRPITQSRFGGSEVDTIIVNSSREILRHIDKETVMVGIDEAQFLDSKLIEVVAILRGRLTVAIAGLDRDFRGLPFGPIGGLLAMADEVHRLTALCSYCKTNPASFSQRLTRGKPSSAFETEVIPEGESDSVIYEPRCAGCFEPPPDLGRWLNSRLRP